jgi:hypothetical protein
MFSAAVAQVVRYFRFLFQFLIISFLGSDFRTGSSSESSDKESDENESLGEEPEALEAGKKRKRKKNDKRKSNKKKKSSLKKMRREEINTMRKTIGNKENLDSMANIET